MKIKIPATLVEIAPNITITGDTLIELIKELFNYEFVGGSSWPSWKDYVNKYLGGSNASNIKHMILIENDTYWNTYTFRLQWDTINTPSDAIVIFKAID